MTLSRDMIPIGRENAVTRRQLCAITGLSDREVRRQISTLRAGDDDANYVIVSASCGRGYYRTDDLDRIEHFIREMRHRISSIVKAIEVAQRIAERLRKRRMYGEGLG